MTGEPKFPDFLIIGAMKCGTTSLHDYLGKHPDIFMTDPKELHFFTNEKFDPKKVDWYKEQFKSEKKLSGSSPQSYTKYHLPQHSGVPARLKQYMPHLKLIYVLRDPIHRIFSHHNEQLEQGLASSGDSLNSLLKKDLENNHYVNTSLYYYQISKFLEHFSLNQIFIVESEKLRDNRLETLNEIFDFLNVRNLFENSLFNFEANTNNTKRETTSMGNFLYSNRIKNLKSLLPESLKMRVKNNSIVQRITHKTITKDNLDPSIENQLRDYLSEDTENLRNLTGNKYKYWSV